MSAPRTRALDPPSLCAPVLLPAIASAVGFAAVFYGEDQDGVAEILKADAVVADPETHLGRFDILEALGHAAFARGEITSHNMQNADCCSLVDRAKVGFGFVSPGDLLPHRYWPLLSGSSGGPAHALEIFEGKAKLGEHFFMGNGRVILEPFFGGFDGANLFFADRFVVNGSVGETAGHGIADRLKEMNNGGELLHRQHVEQRVGLLGVLE